MATKRELNVGRSFGKALCFFRKRAQMTQDELGRSVGYSRTHISLLESDRRKPDPSTVAALFLPALGLTQSAHEAERLLQLASAAQGKPLSDFGIRLHDIRHTTARGRDQDSPTDHRPQNHPQAAASGNDALSETLAWYIQMDPDAALRLANALAPMWTTQKNYRVARAWLSQILALSTSPTVSKAEALLHASQFAQRQRDWAEATRWGEQALALYHEQEDLPGIASTLAALGWAAFEASDVDRASAFFRRSLEIEQALNRPRQRVDVLLALVHMTNVWSVSGAQHLEVEIWLQTCEAISRETGYTVGLAHTLRQRGALEIARSNAAQALGVFEQSLELFRQAQLPYEVSWSELAIGEALLFLNALPSARAHVQRARAGFREAEQVYGVAIAVHHMAGIDLREGKLDAAQAGFAEALRLSHACESPYMIARCIVGLAGADLQKGSIDRAAQLLRIALTQIHVLPAFLSPYDLAHLQQMQRVLTHALGPSALSFGAAEGHDVATIDLDRDIAWVMQTMAHGDEPSFAH